MSGRSGWEVGRDGGRGWYFSRSRTFEGEGGQRGEVLEDADLALELLDLAADPAQLDLDLEHVLELAGPLLRILVIVFSSAFLFLMRARCRNIARSSCEVRLFRSSSPSATTVRRTIRTGQQGRGSSVNRTVGAGRAGGVLLGDVAATLLHEGGHLLRDRVDALDD